MMLSVNSECNDLQHRKYFQGIDFQELLYARSARSANVYLHLIEQESGYLQLKLHHGKCTYI